MRKLTLILTQIALYCACVAQTWSPVSVLPGSARTASPGFSIGNTGYIVGGESFSTTLTDCWSYNAANDLWALMAPYPGTPKLKPAAFSINGFGYYGLGTDSTFYKYDPISNLWTQLTAPSFGLNYWSSMYFTIGSDAYFLFASSNVFAKYNTISDTWTQLNNFPGTARFTGSGFAIGNKGYITCGVNSFSVPYLNDLWEYDPTNDSWTAKSSLPATGRYATLALSANGKGYLLGGEIAGNTNVNEFWEYDQNTDSWSALAPYLGGSRNYLSGFSIGNNIYVGLGSLGFNNDFYVFGNSSPSPCVSLPTNLQNGLVGWWPFCGNANDESGNGNDGVVNGATLTSDRFGNQSNAFLFDGVANHIEVLASTALNNLKQVTISYWLNVSSLPPAGINSLSGTVTKWYGAGLCNSNTDHFGSWIASDSSIYGGTRLYSQTQDMTIFQPSSLINTWHHIIFIHDSVNGGTLYFDGVMVSQVPTFGSLCTTINNLYFGCDNGLGVLNRFFSGKLDDIGIWNRALTPNEITQLNCGILPVVNPPAAITSTGTNAVFTASASVNNVSYQWQTNPANTGWVNVIDNATYSGSSANQLTVSNVQLSNHLQPFRVIASDTNCTDTSNVGSIFISDTCLVTVYDTAVVTVYDSITVIDTLLVTVYDTIYTSVTDTLIITVTGLQTPTGGIDVLVYPNPASASVQINFGPDYTAMVNYNLRIYNAGGSNVYGPVAGINQQLFTVPIASWAPGIYFLELLDTGTSNTIVRKIVIQ